MLTCSPTPQEHLTYSSTSSEESRVKLKVCCMKSIDEIHLAAKYGATAVGLVGEMPSGPGIISDTEAELFAKSAPDHLETFLLTSRTNATDIAAHIELIKPTTVQLVWHLDTEIHRKLADLTNVKRVQVIHVEDETAIELARGYAPFVDALLLDSGKPSASTIELGGTGRTHDWSLRQKIVESVDIPVYLAGGLDPDNIQEAVETVQPYGVDLCSGVRSNNKLDEHKLAAFTENLFG